MEIMSGSFGLRRPIGANDRFQQISRKDKITPIVFDVLVPALELAFQRSVLRADRDDFYNFHIFPRMFFTVELLEAETGAFPTHPFSDDVSWFSAPVRW